jgi:hypothetical protein
MLSAAATSARPRVSGCRVFNTANRVRGAALASFAASMDDAKGATQARVAGRPRGRVGRSVPRQDRAGRAGRPAARIRGSRDPLGPITWSLGRPVSGSGDSEGDAHWS